MGNISGDDLPSARGTGAYVQLDTVKGPKANAWHKSLYPERTTNGILNIYWRPIGFVTKRLRDCVPKEDRIRCPPELASRGVTDAEWVEWMDKLAQAHNALPSVLGGRIGQVSVAVLTAGLAIVFGAFTKAYAQFDAEIASWQRNFNSQVLNPRGIHLKIRSKRPVCIGRDKAVANWLAFAFTPEAITHLIETPNNENPCFPGEFNGQFML